MLRLCLSRLNDTFKSFVKIQDIRDKNPDAKIGSGVRVLGSPANFQAGEGAEIEDGAILDFRFGGSIQLGRAVKMRSGVILAPFGGSISVGDGSGFNHYSVIYGHGGLNIGSLVRFAAHCLVIPANHGTSDSGVPICRQLETKKGISIGDDIWVGAHSIILDGVTIGDGSVIAAGSVVSKNVEPHTVVAGVPNKLIRRSRIAGRVFGVRRVQYHS